MASGQSPPSIDPFPSPEGIQLGPAHAATKFDQVYIGAPYLLVVRRSDNSRLRNRLIRPFYGGRHAQYFLLQFALLLLVRKAALRSGHTLASHWVLLDSVVLIQVAVERVNRRDLSRFHLRHIKFPRLDFGSH